MGNKFYLTEYSESHTQFSELFSFFEKTEKSFIPPISERRQLSEYIEKLLLEANILLAKELKSDKIIGIAAYYCTPGSFDYAFLTYIAKHTTIKGVGTALVKKMIEDCHFKGMSGIETQTWESNLISLGLFKKNGFKVKELLDNRDGVERSVLLQLSFND